MNENYGKMAKAWVELFIDSLNSEGDGVARMDGLAVFVPGTVPGDTVKAVIQEKKRNYATARVVGLIRSSPDRREPTCAVASRCGGCSLQMMRYEAQLGEKRRQVVDALTRIGGFPLAQVEALTRPTIGMDHPYHYRSKVQFPVAGEMGAPQIGFYAAHSHSVVDHDTCEIQHPVANAVRDAIRRHMIEASVAPYQEATHEGLLRHIVVRLGFATGQVMVILVINGDALPEQDDLIAGLARSVEPFHTAGGSPFSLHSVYVNRHRLRTNRVMGDDFKLIYGQPQIEEHLLGIRYRISPLAFFQVNPIQTERLYQAAVDFAGLSGQETVFDLYCGTGSISLLLAKQARQVIGIEMVAQAIRDANENAMLNGLSNRVRFLTGKAEELLPSLLEQGLRPDVALVDPPRKGCDELLIESIRAVAPDRFVYVSCNPATLARDLARLSADGLYRLDAVQPFDLFPWTSHVECVVQLDLNVATH